MNTWHDPSFLVLLTLSTLVGWFGCKTPAPPLSQEDVSALTQCRHVGIADIKRNLLQAGYHITDSDENSLSTAFLEVERWLDRRRLRRINAVAGGGGEDAVRLFYVELLETQSLDPLYQLDWHHRFGHRSGLLDLGSRHRLDREESAVQLNEGNRTEFEALHQEICRPGPRPEI